MLAENEGKFKGSVLEEMLNQLIERLIEEGYLTLRKKQVQSAEAKDQGMAKPEVSEPLPRNIKFEVTEKGLDFLGYKTLRDLLGSLGQEFRRSSRHTTALNRGGSSCCQQTLRVWRHDQP